MKVFFIMRFVLRWKGGCLIFGVYKIIVILIVGSLLCRIMLRVVLGIFFFIFRILNMEGVFLRIFF